MTAEPSTHSTDTFLIRIDPWRSGWDEFSDYLEKHLDKAPTFHDNMSIYSALENDEVTLWRVFDSKSKTKAFILTRVSENSTYRIGHIDLAVGSDLPDWIHVVNFFKEHFKLLGCNILEVEGRKGWIKLLADYGLKERSVTLTVGL